MVHNYYQIGGGEHTVFKNEVELLKDYGNEDIEYTRSNDELKKSKIKIYMLCLALNHYVMHILYVLGIPRIKV